ncbi:hypothetical protein ASF41_10475 [Methylobacterium sp. Leaf111]|uniref:hypothetical protein n=1 Tax=Methylobacterium sp. Leaf111 TaxID=1736257 RepID=UPI0006F412BB|nr:hypothetical protein [Methylobacterium sp. Leaf111]KQP60094.1 hypothetical protein ASF41_10475 [Methylobacterium sp. Leaf111]
MPHDPPIAARILRAFERAASEPDPIFPFCEGFALIHRHYGAGVLTPEMRREITDALWQAEIALRPELPALFTEDRLRKGVEAFYVLACAWAEPIGAPMRESAEVELTRLSVRIVANDLDSICASIELMRGSATRPPVPMAAQPSASTLLN